MYPKFRIIFVLAFGVLVSMATFVWAAPIPGWLPSATVVSPADTPTTYHIRDMDGRMLTVEVPSLGSPDVRLSDPRQGTVMATVMAIDGQTNQARVRTQEGQTLVLNLSPEAVMGMRVGDRFTLSIAQRLRQ